MGMKQCFGALWASSFLFIFFKNVFHHNPIIKYEEHCEDICGCFVVYHERQHNDTPTDNRGCVLADLFLYPQTVYEISRKSHSVIFVCLSIPKLYK